MNRTTKVALQQSLALFAANGALAGLVIWSPPVSAFVADALAITAFLAQWCGHRLGLKGVLWRYSPICGPWMGILLVLALLNALVLTPVVHSPNHGARLTHLIQFETPMGTRSELLKWIPIGTPLNQAEAALVKNGFRKLEDPSKWPEPQPGTAPRPSGKIAEDAPYVTYGIHVPIDWCVTRDWFVQLYHQGGVVEDIKVKAGGLTGP